MLTLRHKCATDKKKGKNKLFGMECKEDDEKEKKKHLKKGPTKPNTENTMD